MERPQEDDGRTRGGTGDKRRATGLALIPPATAYAFIIIHEISRGGDSAGFPPRRGDGIEAR